LDRSVRVRPMTGLGLDWLVEDVFHEQFEGRFEKLVVYAHTSRMLDWREWVLDNILDITPDVDLAQGDLHVLRSRVCEHDEFDVGGSLIVVELVLRCTIGQEAVLVAPELSNHVAQ